VWRALALGLNLGEEPNILDIDGHSGPWQTGQKCREFWTPQEYKAYAKHPLNVPRY